MWALVYTIIVIGTTTPTVYSVGAYDTYVECFKMQQFHSPKLDKNETLNCIMVKWIVFGLMFIMLIGDVPIIKLIDTYDSHEACLYKQIEIQPHLQPTGEFLECWQLASEE